MDQLEGQPVRVKQPSGKKKKKRGRGLGTVLLTILIIATLALFAWGEYQRRETARELKATQSELQHLRESTQNSGQEAAERVLTKLKSHFAIPQDAQPTVATIVDVESLRENNTFYNRAQNGDHIIIITDPPRAILYDPDNDIILDVVPVSLEQAEQQQGATATEGEPATLPTGSPQASPEASPTPAL